jgi:hypothetical protein
MLHSRNNEGVERADGILFGALEPTLVTNLALEDVQVAIRANGGLDQLMAAALITIGRADEELVGVVIAALLVLLCRVIKERRCCVATISKASLRLGRACITFGQFECPEGSPARSLELARPAWRAKISRS